MPKNIPTDNNQTTFYGFCKVQKKTTSVFSLSYILYVRDYIYVKQGNFIFSRSSCSILFLDMCSSLLLASCTNSVVL